MDKLEQLYNSLKSNPNIKGLPTDYATFKTSMQDEGTAQQFYNAIKSNTSVTGLPNDYETFSTALDLKKKGGTTTTTSIPSKNGSSNVSEPSPTTSTVSQTNSITDIPIVGQSFTQENLQKNQAEQPTQQDLGLVGVKPLSDVTVSHPQADTQEQLLQKKINNLGNSINFQKSVHDDLAIAKLQAEQNPNDDAALTKIGLSLMDDPNQKVQAQNVFQSAVNINPQNYQARAGLGYIDFNNKDYQSAIDNYTTALQNISPSFKGEDGKDYVNPQYIHGLTELSRSEFMLGKETPELKPKLLQSANVMVDEILRNFPDNVDANVIKSNIEKELGNAKSSLEYQNKALTAHVEQTPVKTMLDLYNEFERTKETRPLSEQIGSGLDNLGNAAGQFIVNALNLPEYVGHNAVSIGEGIADVKDAFDKLGLNTLTIGDTEKLKDYAVTPYEKGVAITQALKGGVEAYFGWQMLKPHGWVFTQQIGAADVLTNGEASKLLLAPLQSYLPTTDDKITNNLKGLIDGALSIGVFHLAGTGFKGESTAVQDAYKKYKNGEKITGEELKLLQGTLEKTLTPEITKNINEVAQNLPKDTPTDDVIKNATDVVLSETADSQIKKLNSQIDEILKQENVGARDLMKVGDLTKQIEDINNQVDEQLGTSAPELLQKITDLKKEKSELYKSEKGVDILKDSDREKKINEELLQLLKQRQQLRNNLLNKKITGNATTKISEQTGVQGEPKGGTTSPQTEGTGVSDSVLGTTEGEGQQQQVGQTDALDEKLKIIGYEESEIAQWTPEEKQEIIDSDIESLKIIQAETPTPEIQKQLEDLEKLDLSENVEPQTEKHPPAPENVAAPIAPEPKPQELVENSGEPKSILNQDTDLKGGDKEVWMVDKPSYDKVSDKDERKILEIKVPTIDGGDKAQFEGLKNVVYDKGKKNITAEIPDTPKNRELLTDTKGKITKTRISPAQESKQYYDQHIKTALEKGKYEKAISEGKMTFDDAKKIIESAGFEVPKDLQPKEQSLKPTTKTEVKKSEPEPKTSTELKLLENIYVGDGVSLVKDQSATKVRNDENHHSYSIQKNGKEVGRVSFNYREDLGGYQIENIKVGESGTGIGTSVYKSLINTLDKPLISDKSRTQSADHIWNKLVKEGFAKYDKEQDKYFSESESTSKTSTVSESGGEKTKPTEGQGAKNDKPIENEPNINTWTKGEILSNQKVKEVISGESMSLDSNKKWYVGVNVLHDKVGNVKFIGNFQEAPKEIQDKFHSGEYENSIYKITLDKKAGNADNIEWIQDSKGDRKSISENPIVQIKKDEPVFVKPNEIVELEKPLRNEKLNVPTGNEGSVKFSDETSVPFKYVLIEAKDLQPSHLPSGERNPQHHIEGAQPKERNDQESLLKQDDIANNMNFEEVSNDVGNAYFGSPIVNARGEVIQGNNRSIGTKKHYDKGKKVYKEELLKNAEKYGLTKEQVEAMDEPVLARMVDVSDTEAIVLGNYDVKDLETGGKQRLDPIAISRRISPQDKARLANILFGGDATTIKDAIRTNAKAVYKIIGGDLNSAQRKNLLNDKQEFTAQGMEDLENVVMHFLFENGKATLPEMFDHLPETIRVGLKKSLPSILNLPPEKSILTDIQNAMIAMYEFKNSGVETFGEWATNTNIFKGVNPKQIYTPLELKIGEMVSEAKTQADIKKIFAQYKDKVTDKPATLTDPEIKGISREQAVKETFKTEYYERQNTPDNKQAGAEGTPVRESKIKNLDDKEKGAKEVGEIKEVINDANELLKEEPNLDVPIPKEQIKFERNTDKIKKIDDELDDLLGSFGKKALTGLDPEQSAKSVKVVGLLMQKGYYKFEDMMKWAVEKGLNELIPYLKSAYQTVRDNFDLSNELKYSLDNDAEINKVKSEGLKSEKFAPRPPMRMADEGKLPTPKEHIVEGDYNNEINATQRLGANMAIDRFEKGGKGFLLADGAGFGKTRQELVIANEMQERTGKKSLIVTENQAIIDGSFRNQARTLGLNLSNFETGTYSELADGKIGKGDYGVVIYDEAHNLKNPLAQRSIAQSKVKSEHNVFATATPMDKIEHGLYFLSEITDKDPKEIQKELKLDIEWKKGKDGEMYSEISTSMDAKHYYEKLLELRDKAIENGAMIRREFPFYGEFENGDVKMTHEQLKEKNEIETVHQARMDAAENIAIGKLVNSILNPKKFGGDLGQFKGDLANKLAFDKLFTKIKADYEAGKGQYYSEAKNAIKKFEKDERFAMLQNLDKLNEQAKVDHIFKQVKKDLADGKQSIVVGNFVGEHTIKAGTKNSKYGYYERTIKSEDALLNAIAKKLDAEGIPYSKILGGNKKSGYTIEQDKFQNGDTKVMLMTAKSGGTGIDLDDSSGKAQRVMHIATSDYSGNKMEQLFGRVSRMNTKSPALIRSYYFDDNYADQNRKTRSQEKQTTIKNIVSGKEDLDAHLKDNAEEIAGQEKTKQKNAIVETRGNDIIVKGDTFGIKDKIKELGARWDGGEKAWKLPKEKEPLLDKVLEENNIGKSVEQGLPLFGTPKLTLDQKLDNLSKKIDNIQKDFNDKTSGLNSLPPFTKQFINKILDQTKVEIENAKKAIKDTNELIAKIKEIVDKAITKINSLKYTKEQQKLVDEITDGLKKESDVEVVGNGEHEIVGDGGKETGIRHATTAEIRKKYGLAEYERNNATDEQLEAAANEAIKKGYNPERLISQMEDLIPPTGVENFILKKYVADLEAKFEKDKSQETLDQIERVVKATDKIGSIQSEAFRTRGGIIPVDDSLAGFFIKEKEINNGAPLTENQKGVVEKEFEAIKEATNKYEEKIAQLEKQLAEKNANEEFEKTKKKVKKESKKTHDEYVKEREDIVASMREKLKKARGESNVVVLPYAKELIAISPDVLRMVKSYATEGLDKLDFIIDNIHDVLKENIPQITKKDINDIIAGEYTEKKKTRNEISKTVTDLKQQAKLVNKLSDLQKGIEPKKEGEKIKRNQEITNLQNQIKDFVKERDAQDAEIKKLKDQLESEANKPTPEKAALDSLKKKLANQILELEKDLRTGNFDNTPPKPKLKLDKEAIALKDELIKKKQQREVRIMQAQYANRNRYQRWRDKALDVLNVPRTIMSSMDFSAPLRQAVIATVTHPKVAAKAGLEMFKQAFSQKRFDRWFHDVRADHRYTIMEDSGLYVADPHDPRLTAKEEAFMNNLAEKIPFVGKMIKGSERAYVGYLNKMRVDLFNQFMDEFEAQGKTFDNSPELYKGLASYINNATGRGKLGVIESAAPVMNAVFFSPRLIASRLNLLSNWANPKFYKEVPKEVRSLYFKDMAKFIALGSTILFLASLATGDDEDEVVMDARSSDFGKIKFGNTRWDIWGGFQQYIRIFTQLMTGESRSANTGLLQDLSGEGRFGKTRGDVALSFVRGKLAPIPSMIADVLNGRTVMGDKPTLLKEAESHFLPLIYSDVKSAMQEKGASALFTVGIPATFGVGVQTYLPREKEIPKTIENDGKKIKLDEERYKEFSDMATDKIFEYKSKLKNLPEYQSTTKEEQLKLEKIATDAGVKYSELKMKEKHPELFTDMTEEEIIAKEKESQFIEDIKDKIGISADQQ